MKISKKIILKYANELLRSNGSFTQVELHTHIERRIGRQLTANEKRRITMILRNEYVVSKVERDRNNSYARIFYFF